MIAKLLGKESRTYTNKSTGELKEFRAAHVIWEGRQKNGLEGTMVEVVTLPRDVDYKSLRIGESYDIVYGAYGRYARVERFDVVGK